jgi:mono/diheme cytochrome c family protein
MLRVFFLIFILAAIAVVSLAGFRGIHSAKPPIEIFVDMVRNPRFDPQHESDFYSDTRAARRPVPGTVPLGYSVPNAFLSTGANNNKLDQEPGAFSNSPDYYNSGRIGAVYGDGIPLKVDRELLDRGRERFNINCAVCHGPVGLGNGITSQYGLVGIANFHDARIRTMPDGQIFNTITLGKNTMGAYGSNISVEDRWAIITYIRALERADGASINDVPADLRAQIQTATPATPASPASK